MIKGKVLINGGAGFIGSHTADALRRRGYEIRILDNLSSKSYFGSWPEYLNPEFEKIKGDVRDEKTLTRALRGIDFVIHLAAMMDYLPDYSNFFDINVTPTALLYEIIVRDRLPIKKIVVASSQFVYGEGRWQCRKHGIVFPKLRTPKMMCQRQFDPVCPIGGEHVSPLLSQETHQDPLNHYAISKYTQELIALKLGKLVNIPSVAMRYSIVHGPRQSLKNAYSGALRIFTLKMLANQPPLIFEDGLSKRDYVSVYDVARANTLVLESDAIRYESFNVGSGRTQTVLDLARLIREVLGKDKIEIKPCEKFRLGDVRHAISDISKLKKFGWRPKDSEEKIVREYVSWVKKQKLNRDYATLAEKKMEQFGIIRSLESN